MNPPPRRLAPSARRSLCMWQLDADHPDKNGLQLRKLAFVLKAAAKHAAENGYKFGVFWDYCACAAAPSNLRPNAHHHLTLAPLSLAPAGCRSAPARPPPRARTTGPPRKRPPLAAA